MKIEILVVPSCPHAEPAAELVRRALDQAGLHDSTFMLRVITRQDEAERLGFTGSPTFLIGGQDPFGEHGREPGLACRVYRTPHGLAGLPTIDQLKQALHNAAN